MAGTPLKDIHDLDGRGVADSRATASSLLLLVKASDEIGWQRLVQLYTPLLRLWTRRAGLQAEDGADVVQEVFHSVHSQIADFRRDRAGDSFRKWLKTITNNKIRDLWRRRGVLRVYRMWLSAYATKRGRQS